MKWSSDAEKAIKKVPFFVRKKVKKRVETHAAGKGKSSVDLIDVTELKKKFLAKGGMESEIKGYEISACFGGSGCSNTAVSTQQLVKEIETIFKNENLLSFLRAHVDGDLKFHHEFRVVLSDCPNACSRPQIADIGIIGAVTPGIGDEPCSQCNACIEVCKENAIRLDGSEPVIQMDECIRCGQCIRECPTGTLIEKEKGYRVLLGGRLGRHPRLGMEVPGTLNHDQVIRIIKNCLTFYKTHSKKGKRFSHILESIDQVL